MLRRAPPFGHYEGFFYPLDKIAHWNRGYGRRGFAQYQFVIPFADGARRLRDILTAILSSGELPFLNVLKRMGKPSGGLLSFPSEGYTLAIDFPIRANTVTLLRRLDAMVLDAGGASTWARTPTSRPPAFARCIPRSRAGSSSRPGTTRATCSPPTSAAASAWCQRDSAVDPECVRSAHSRFALGARRFRRREKIGLRPTFTGGGFE